MTAYVDRVRRLAGGQPSLRVRPRSRFEPVSPGSEPPWERTVPDATLSPFQTHPPFESDDEAGAEKHPILAVPSKAASPGSEPPWERTVPDVTVSPFDTESPFESGDEAGTHPTGPRGNVPLTGDMAEKRPVPAVPAANHPDTAGARPWSSLSSERSPSSSPVPSASAVPERTVIRPPTTALPVSADPAETASSQTRSTRRAAPGEFLHLRRDETPTAIVFFFINRPNRR